uniref:Uncharacterized protein n=1 Tax=Sus scrofa TaxID=9823 RepID=A0A8D1DAL5_PIG
MITFKKKSPLNFFFFFFCFLGPLLWHMEVPRLGVESELQLPAYTTATATPDPSRVCDLHYSSQQRRILNPLSEARDRTCVLMDTSQIRFHGATMGTLTLNTQFPAKYGHPGELGGATCVKCNPNWGQTQAHPIPPTIWFPPCAWSPAYLFGKAQGLFTDDPGTGGWVRELVDLDRGRRGPLHPALHLLIHGAWRRGAGHLVVLLGVAGSLFQATEERGTGPVCGALLEDLETVGRGQALPPVEQTRPPALAFRHVLFQNGQDVSSAESQLVRAVRVVVIKCPGQERLGQGRKRSRLLPLPMTLQ